MGGGYSGDFYDREESNERWRKNGGCFCGPKIEDLQKRVAELEATNAELESRVTALRDINTRLAQRGV